MSIFFGRVARGTLSTLVGYGATQSLRFGTSVLIARLLAPELFGLMVIVNTIRTGVELLSDLGITQGVVQARNAEDPNLYNTAWTLKIIRGVALFLVCIALAVPVSRIFENPDIAIILPVSGLTFLMSGFTAMAVPILQRRLALVKLNTFEILTAALYSIFQVAVAYIYPTIWALVLGLLFGSFVTMIGSFFLIPTMRHKFIVVRENVAAIVHFGKWVALASAMYFLTASFDRLYLAGAITLGLLGIYGIARTIAEIVILLFLKIGNSIVFPYISTNAHKGIAALRSKIAPARFGFVALSAVAIGVLASAADLAVEAVFDQRYHSAGWMLFILMCGVWFSILSSLNDAILLGIGKSHYGAAANGAKFLWLVASFPIVLPSYGVAGAALMVSVSEFVRLLPILFGQFRERFAFAMQDLAATVVFFVVLAASLAIRSALGGGTPL